jgi:membrane protein DedA with SNARE-associated domain
MSEVSWARFSVLNFIAAGVWAISFAGTGYLFGAAFKDVLGDYALYITLGMLLMFVSFAWFVISAPERREKRLAKEAARLAAQSGSATNPKRV